MSKKTLHVAQHERWCFGYRKMGLLLCLMLSFIVPSKAVLYTLGTGTTSVTSSNITPFATGWDDNRTQYLYLASEFTAAGASAGTITSIAFNITSLGGQSPDNVNISIGTTTASTISGFTSGLTNSFSAATLSPTLGWNTYTLSTPFVWNGSNNIVIEVCRDNSSSSYNYGVETTTFSIGDTRTASDYQDWVAGCSMPSASSSTDTRPNCQFDITPAALCSGVPNAGTAVTSSTSVCQNTNFTLSLSGATIAGGLTYQWYESPLGANAWSVIGPATNPSYTSPMTAGDMDYFCEVTCGTAKDSSTIVSVMVNPFYNCYCASAALSIYDGEIYNVTVGALNNTSTCSQTGGQVLYLTNILITAHYLTQIRYTRMCSILYR